MYHLNAAALPKDSEFPTHLKSLGYFIDAKNCIKSVEYPNELFSFQTSNNERYNEMRREAVHSAVREEILKRLKDLAILPLYLPQLTETKPECDPNVQILMTPGFKLRCKPRVVVVINRSREDLGVWAWRMVKGAPGIERGSAVAFAKEANEYGEDAPGMIITNPGQLLYSHRKNTTMTPTTWNAQPRESAVHLAPKIDPVHNRVKGNASMEEHIAFVFENIIANEVFVSKRAEIYLVGIGDGGDVLVKYLHQNWLDVSSRIVALALTAPCNPGIEKEEFDSDFVYFLRHRTRAWDLSAHPLNTPLANPGLPSVNPYQRVSSGHTFYVECIMVNAFPTILDWFESVATVGPMYGNPMMEIPEEVRDEAEKQAVDATGGPEW